MALALLVSIVTGAIVYGPMTQRFAFGLIRRRFSRRTALADLRELVGAATFGWTLLVTVTGLLLSLGSFVIQYYAATELALMAKQHGQETIVEDYGTVDAAVVRARASAPGRHWQTIALPGSDLASPTRYTVLLEGGAGIESRMLTLALVDARTATSAEVKELPWYLKALLLSEPLHFGDYGGVTLELVWTLFGLATVALSVTGVWVFWSARRDRRTRRHVGPVDEDEPLVMS